MIAGFRIRGQFVKNVAVRRFAYAFYATNDTYAIAVMVFVRLLRRQGMRAGIDLVVLHVGVSERLLERMRDMGLRLRQVDRPRCSRHRFYRDSFVKLRIFELDEYERIVYVDADALPLAPLDDLFLFPFDGPIAAPRAYWQPQPKWGSYLMVVAPSREASARIERHLPLAADNRHFDMDIVNAAFAGAIATLPDDVVRLNSDWEDVTRHSPERMEPLVIHFTALGKPWSYDVRRVRRLRPSAHPLFYEIWDTWRATRDELFAGRPFLERVHRRMSDIRLR